MPLRLPFRIAALSIVLAASAGIAAPHAFAACANTLIDDNGQSFCADNAPAQTTPTTSSAPLQNTGGTSGLQNTGGTVGTPGASGNNSGTLLVNPLKGISSLSDLLDAIINAIVDIGTIVLILALIWVGFSFVKAQGKEKEIAQARAALLWTVIGGAILLGAKALSEVIQSTVSNL